MEYEIGCHRSAFRSVRVDVAMMGFDRRGVIGQVADAGMIRRCPARRRLDAVGSEFRVGDLA
jgi:hypothetical protein